MSVRVELLHTTPARDIGRRRTTGPVLATAAVVLGLAVSAVAAFAQSQPAIVFPPPADFLDAAPVAKPETRSETTAKPKVETRAKPAPIVGTPLPPPRPAQAEAKPETGSEAEPAKRVDRLEPETKPARRSQKLAYLPAPAGSWNRDDGTCRPPRIVIDDYWRGGPIIDCRGRFRPR